MRDDAALEKWAEQVGAKVANCAGCGCAVSRRAPLPGHKLAGRIRGRPYCHACLRASRGPGRRRRGT